MRQLPAANKKRQVLKNVKTSNSTQYRRNPYLFILLKKLLYFEFVGFAQQPTHRELGKKISEREENAIIKHLDATSSLRNSSKKFKGRSGETIRTKLLGTEIFKFSTKMLDRLAQQITELDQFHSWEHFISRYKEDKGAVIAQERYMEKEFEELQAETKQAIYSWVDKRIIELHFRKKRYDEVNQPNIIRNTEEFAIRTPNLSELFILNPADKRTEPYIRNWYTKNTNQFYVYLDYYGIWGELILLAIHNDSIKAMLDGYLNYPNIPIGHLHMQEEKTKIRHVHVFRFEYPTKNIQKLFLQDFGKMIRSLTTVAEKNLTISTLKYPDQPSLCDFYTFNQVGKVLDKEAGITCDYYETSWASLKDQMKSKKMVSELRKNINK